ncbi:AAA family ATPase [Accumulibacter sp.]|uniref:ExeA family protein n=1 Tax=Accumulibacter sp. TaxID=2053492 RepID=UPI001AC65A0E|nr:AAA family ATPase [Accumulibacter sp.]MBN8452246.1 AAA family ATPase [Accumulibacter sp.]
MLILGDVLARHGISQATLARKMHLSPAAVSLLVRHNQYPRTIRRRDLRSMACAVLTKLRVPVEELTDLFLESESPPVGETEKLPALPAKATEPRSNAAPSGNATPLERCIEMLLRKQTLSDAARRKFGIFRDPFEDPTEAREVYLSRDIRYVREALWQVAAGNTKFLALIGESGSGKSTLREELEERLRLENRPVRLIQPYVLAMEDSDRKGQYLRSDHIAEAILHAVASGESPRRSPEARFRQVHEALIASSRVGVQHLLVIEEAHGLPIPTLKHLKRFLELKDGMRRLLSVLLIGQPELRDKLDERRASVREVAQRCQIVGLPPLDANLGEYLAHRFTAAGLDLAAVVEPAAIDALMQALTIRQRTGAGPNEIAVISLTHPLVANNLLTAAINQAATLGAPRVTAELVRAVREQMP